MVLSVDTLYASYHGRFGKAGLEVDKHFARKGGALEWLTHHEHIHIGQIGLLRRTFGERPIEYLDESRNGKDFV